MIKNHTKTKMIKKCLFNKLLLQIRNIFDFMTKFFKVMFPSNIVQFVCLPPYVTKICCNILQNIMQYITNTFP